MTIKPRVNVYLDYGRTFFPENVTQLQALSGKPKTFRFAYKRSDGVYTLGACKGMTRDDCKDKLRRANTGYDLNIVPSVESIR